MKSNALLLVFMLAVLGCGDVEDEVSCDDGQCDLIGDLHRGHQCHSNWECSSDEGLSCIPVKFVSGRGSGYQGDRECLPTSVKGGPCDDERDCLLDPTQAEDDGLRCRPTEAVIKYDRIEGYQGHCEEKGEAGKLGCDTDEDCVDGLECHLRVVNRYANGYAAAERGMCAYPSCIFDTSCQRGRVCRPAADDEWVNTDTRDRRWCQTPGERGAICTEDSDCSDAFVCMGNWTCDSP